MTSARLLIDDPLPGPTNMARDEALLQSCTGSDFIPVLRFYQWVKPTISLGYFQDYAEYEQLAPPVRDLPVVRRTTGGGAILHDLEVTYSLVVPIAHPLIAGRPTELYRLVHLGIILAVGHGARLFGEGANPCDAGDNQAQRGPFFCFERRHDLDVVVDDRAGPRGTAKLAGSAQRRTQTAILQHGSIIIASRYMQQPVATWRSLEGPTDFGSAVQRLTPHFAAAMKLDLNAAEWPDRELNSARTIESRYAGAAWTRDRQRE